MLFRQFFDCTSCSYSYLIASDTTGEAIMIDPVLEQVPTYLQFIKELDLDLVASLETHLHADHITGSGKLRSETQCEIMMSELSKAQGVTHELLDNEQIEIGELSFIAMHTPGHTDDSFCFCFDDRILTGDTLFIRGTGRTDFQHGNALDAYDSLFNKILKLPPGTLVYPAHNYSGCTVSTIGEELKFNPRLQVKSAEEYKTIMDNLNLPKPKLIDVAVPANMQCGLIDENI